MQHPVLGIVLERCTLVAVDMDVLTQRHVTMTQRRFTIMVIVQNMIFVIFVVEDGSSCSGCTNPIACNYNPSVTIDDGSCIIGGVEITFTILTDNYPGEDYLEYCRCRWISSDDRWTILIIWKQHTQVLFV